MLFEEGLDQAIGYASPPWALAYRTIKVAWHIDSNHSGACMKTRKGVLNWLSVGHL